MPRRVFHSPKVQSAAARLLRWADGRRQAVTGRAGYGLELMLLSPAVMVHRRPRHLHRCPSVLSRVRPSLACPPPLRALRRVGPMTLCRYREDFECPGRPP